MNEYDETTFPYVLTVWGKGKKPVTIKFSVKGEAEEYIRKQKCPFWNIDELSQFEEDFGYKPTKHIIKEE